MNCKYMKPKINKGTWCTRDDIRCTNCNNKEYDIPKCTKILKNCAKTNNKIKKKSKELAKLERNRFSILTSDLKHCIICGSKKDNLHEIFFGANRVNSMKYGCVIPLCLAHHQEMHRNKEWQDYWHRKCQKKFMEYYHKSINEFIDVFGKNYL